MVGHAGVPHARTGSSDAGAWTGPRAGQSCSSQTQPFNIVSCRRLSYGGHMSNDQVVAFEKSVAST
jgi:hypothetical protein